MVGIDGVINWRRGKSIIPWILELKGKLIHNGYSCAYSIARLSEIEVCVIGIIAVLSCSEARNNILRQLKSSCDGNFIMLPLYEAK